MKTATKSQTAGVPLSTDLDDPEAFPYFLWDDPMTNRELRERLETASPVERLRLLGKILREVRDTDVWRFTTPREVADLWPALSMHLGRRRAFWQFLLTVWHVPQISAEKPLIGTIRIDPPEEILVNKLCTLLSRAEIRDLVDVRELVRAGYSIEEHLVLAARKDGGLTPGQLAWVLSQVEIGDDARIPGELSARELREYLQELQDRLGAMAFPIS